MSRQDLYAGIAECAEAVGADEVLPRAIAIAKAHSGKDPDTYGAIRAGLYRETLASLRDASARPADAERFRFAFELIEQSRT